MLDGAHGITVPAGGFVFRDGDGPTVLIVVRGLLRTYLATAGGRELTIRYSRAGAIVGVGSLTAQPAGMNVAALIETRFVGLRAATLLQLARTDARVAFALFQEANDRLAAYMEQVGGASFSTLRQRVARHLLDIAAAETSGASPLVARLSQQALAQHVGSVREVVVRILRELREEVLVRTARDEIVIVDPARLAAQTWQP
ncbi:MAG: Crp/Fnr family transcriptional regulator [Frankiaceae bacterium]